MNEHLQARMEAIRLGITQQGSLNDKIEAAEAFYEFLEKGIAPPTHAYAYVAPPASYVATRQSAYGAQGTITLTATNTTSNNG